MWEYARQYRLQIGSGEDALLIDSLRLVFSITHSNNAKPNNASIKIYNLSRNTVNNILDGVNDRYHHLTLSVGYGDLNATRVLFSGQVTKGSISRSGTDSLLVLTCDDGATDYRNAFINTTLSAGCRHSDILAQCQATMPGVTPGLLGIDNDVALPRGRTCYGMTRHVLNQLAAHHNADWSIQNGSLIFMGNHYVRPGEPILISQQTGMLNAPKVADNGGLEVTCLLRPEIQIGSRVRLDSIIDAYDGDYKVLKIASAGDTHDSQWQSTLTLESGVFTASKAQKTQGTAG